MSPVSPELCSLMAPGDDFAFICFAASPKKDVGIQVFLICFPAVAIILPLSPTCLPLGVPFSLLGCGDFAMHGLLCFTLHHHMVRILVLL